MDPQNIPWDRLQVSRERYRVWLWTGVNHAADTLHIQCLGRGKWCSGGCVALLGDYSLNCLSGSVQHTRLQEYHNYVNRQDVMYQSASWLREQSVAVCMVVAPPQPFSMPVPNQSESSATLMARLGLWMVVNGLGGCTTVRASGGEHCGDRLRTIG